MSKLVNFPQRQHEEFSLLVQKAMEDEARDQNLMIDDYIQKIYYHGEIPQAFAKTSRLNKLYHQYHELIEDAVSSVEGTSTMKNSNKAYLCYRIYLHGMTIERKVMSEAEAKQQLINALKEFFYAKGKMLSLSEEMSLIETLTLATEQAQPLRFT